MCAQFIIEEYLKINLKSNLESDRRLHGSAQCGVSFTAVKVHNNDLSKFSVQLKCTFTNTLGVMNDAFGYLSNNANKQAFLFTLFAFNGELSMDKEFF